MSPAVWDDVLPRILAAAASLGLLVVLPNEDAGERPNPPAPWLDLEISANSSETIELGGAIWNEEGTIWLHVMVPVGTGIATGLALRKGLANAFRGVTDSVVGLVYRNEMAMDPAGPATDDGVYRPLTLLIRYHFQDTT
jgi:hypothetical protein